MTCNAASLLLVQIGRNTPIDSKLKSMALDHARDCRACGPRLANERMLSAGFDILVEENFDLRPGPATKTAVMLAYRKKFAGHQKVRVMWTAAAALAACLSLVSLAQMVRPANLRPPSVVDLQAADFAAIATDAAYAGDTAEGPFIPIPYAEPIAPEERTELQRVKLTRGTLIAMGVSTEAPDVDEPMNAELVVGQDGVPRAVRILN